MKIAHLRIAILTALAVAAGFVASAVNAATVAWTDPAALTAWYTATNWTPNTASGAWLSSDIAQFNNTGTATTATINITTSSLSIGAIEDSALRTRVLTISNSTATAGTLTLNGVAVNGVSDTILRNASNSLLTLTNGSGAMNVVLGNASNNVVQIDGAGGINILNNITGSGRNLTLQGSGAGVLGLFGTNTYSGVTTVSQGTLLLNTQSTTNTSGYTINDANTGANNTTLRIVGAFLSDRAGLGGAGLHDTSPITVANQGNGTTTIDINSSSLNFLNGTAVLNKAVTLKSTTGGGVRAGYMTFSGPGAGAGNTTITYDAAGSASGGTNWNTYEPMGTYTMQPNTYTGNVRFMGGTTSLQNKNYASASYTNMMIPDTASVAIDLGSTASFTFGSEAFDGLNDGVGGGGTLNSNSVATITVGASGGGGNFSGAIGNGAAALSLAKAGAGTQVLGGANSYSGTTTVTGGTLLVNGTHTSAGAYSVTGTGILGGLGTITTASNAWISFAAGTKLAPGTSPGTLTANLGTGTANISGAITAVNSVSMLFDLNTTTTSDRLLLSNALSTLTIGSGLLEFNDFVFTTTGLFGPGTYTLFDTGNTISGTLGSSLNGVVGGYSATLMFANGNQDIVLNVVPEPSSLAMLLFGSVMLWFVGRNRAV